MRSERIKWSILRRDKDEVDKTEVPGIVYAVGCKEVYIGETKRKAHQRIKEHKADTRIRRVDKSASAEHVHVTGHKVHWEAMIIDLLPNYGPGTSKRYRKPVTTGNTVISNCEKRIFRRSSDLTEAKI